MNQKQFQSLCDSAEQWYNFSYRPYHNWTHAMSVVSMLHKMPDVSDEVILAAYWHDAIYIPSAGGDCNEQCSAGALMNEAKSRGVMCETILRAANLIRYTSLEYHAHENQLTGTIAQLLDADLCSFSLPYESFVELQDSIIKENYGDTKTDRKNVAKFLQIFLDCREYIYHTDFMREHCEELARANITKYIAEFSN